MPVADLVQRSLRRFGLQLVPAERGGLAAEATDADLRVLERVRPFTMTSPERLWSLRQSVRYVVENDIPGDLVECGVWRGGSAMAMALTLSELGDSTRRIWLYDTFSGMTEPTTSDVDTRTGRSARQILSRTKRREGRNVWCIAGVDDVRSNVLSTGYPSSLVRFVEGDVVETLQTQRPDSIALLRLDTDWYESTKAELEHLYPLLVPGGVCIIDDYGHWAGARRAVDEYMGAHALTPLVHRIDYTGRVFLNPA
jgi:predicted O-methyltransferase YrrM